MGQSIEGLQETFKQVENNLNQYRETLSLMVDAAEQRNARIKELETEKKQLLSLLREIYNKEYINNKDLYRRLAEATK